MYIYIYMCVCVCVYVCIILWLELSILSSVLVCYFYIAQSMVDPESE